MIHSKAQYSSQSFVLQLNTHLEFKICNERKSLGSKNEKF